MDVWNISNYGSFYFSYILEKYDKSFSELYKDKVIIILDDKFISNNSQTITAHSLIGDFELQQANIQQNIRSYIVGDQSSNIVLENFCQPIQLEGAQLQEFPDEEEFIQYIKA